MRIRGEACAVVGQRMPGTRGPSPRVDVHPGETDGFVLARKNARMPEHESQEDGEGYGGDRPCRGLTPQGRRHQPDRGDTEGETSEIRDEARGAPDVGSELFEARSALRVR